LELLYFKTAGGNFGDDLNQWFWDEVLPGWRTWAPDTVLVGIGTILVKGLLPEGRRKLVLGSGVGYGEIPDIHSNPDEWDIRCVRGPRSASALGLPPAKGLIDPAVLLPEFREFSGLGRGQDCIFIPHHGSLGLLDWNRICEGTGIIPVSPAGDAKTIIRRIATARSVIAESMHAAIIADAFRVPWRSVAISRAFNAFKWQDWAESVEVDLQVTRFFSSLRDVQSLLGRIRSPGRALPQRSGSTRSEGRSAKRSPRVLKPLLEVLAKNPLVGIKDTPYVCSSEEVISGKKVLLLRVLKNVEKSYSAA
jgi:succinoglycan biosynthesis protein ExoV